MSLDKKFPKSKDAKKRLHKYHDSRDFDRSCRAHGSCAWCEGRRTHNTECRVETAKERLKEWRRSHE